MVVVADGSRPVFFFEDGKLEPGAGNGPFFDAIQRHAAPLEGAARAVGRIESDLRLSPSWTDKWYAGSGFLVAPDLLMTNRHVMQLLVNESSSATGPFSLNGPYWVNFAAELSGGSQRFSLEEVLWAGDAVIDTTVDLARLDMALIRLGAPEDGATLPPPLPVSVGPAAQGEVIYVPGYPGRPGIAPGSEPGADTEIDIVLAQLFDRRFGGKRCASGEIDAIPGSWPDDGRQWTVKHDASTLGGNSGSPILSLSRGPAPVALALHFGGQSRLANYGHVFDQLRQRLAAAGATIA
jgi:hypothetical protein